MKDQTTISISTRRWRVRRGRRHLLGILVGLTVGVLGARSADAQVASSSVSLPQHLPFPGEGLAGPYADLLRAHELSGGVRDGTRGGTLHLVGRPGRVGLPESNLLFGPGDGEWSWPLQIPELELLSPHIRVVYNSAYPDSRNDGTLWAGRGISTIASAGFRLRWGPLSLAFAPEWVQQENREFRVPARRPRGSSVLGYSWTPGDIDLPARLGDSALESSALGQSYIRLDAFGFGIGISNENLWWGPAARYPLLMSNTAPGFPHLFLGTSAPLSTPIGNFDLELIWGRLEESEDFTARANRPPSHPFVDRPGRLLLAGAVATYEPHWLPGLYLGAARSYLRELREKKLTLDYETIIGPYREMRDNDAGQPDNQLVSIFGRWAFPEVGFEVYAEWGREDHWGNWDDLILEPDHSQAFMIGFQKVMPTGLEPYGLRIHGEFIRLQQALPQYNTRTTTPPFYRHTKVRQGYTHRGQLLGAGIGPGSNAHFFAIDLFGQETGEQETGEQETGEQRGRGKGVLGLVMVGVFGERVVHDADTYYQIWSRHYGKAGQDIELIGGVRQVVRVGPFDLSLTTSLAHRRNRGFIGLHTPDELDGLDEVEVAQALEGLREWNWKVDLGVGWWGW